MCITGFRYQLRDIIQQNISEIFYNSEYRKSTDFNCVLGPPVEVKQNRELFINLILFSNGVNNKKSTLRKQLWPLWLQIADLPPRRRNSRQNIVLGFGPLYCYSAMSFESANRTLSDLFTGSHSEIEIICRRVLRRHKLARLENKNLRLKKIFDKFSLIPVIDSVGFSDEMIETEDGKLGRSRYQGGTFFNRQHFNNTYFVSPLYKRSKLGNCFVSVSGKVEKFGRIRYFIQMEGAPFFNAVHANVQLFVQVVEQSGSVKGYFY